MPLKTTETTISVVDAARKRIKNLFDSGHQIVMSFSSGKDSLCMSSLTYDLIRAGEIDPKQLTVVFIDEELVYDDMIDAALRWKKNFESVGALFLWFCLPFKQTSVIDGLSANESWITWDPQWRHLWPRNPPPFAIVKSDIISYPGEMNYQTFCRKAFKGTYQMVGIRVAESFARLKAAADAIIEQNKVLYPIYDWRDTDIWRYIRDRNLEFPLIYMKLYEMGTPKARLRLCNFFGEGSSAGLPIVSEIDPEQWDKICKREPNAQLALLYWDSEMFGRKTKTRKELEEKAGIEQKKNYREMLEDLLFFNTEKYNIGKDTIVNMSSYRRIYKKAYYAIDESDCKRMYEWIVFGDPKRKGVRTIPTTIFSHYAKQARKEDGNV